jgi:hypothetical protein
MFHSLTSQHHSEAYRPRISLEKNQEKLARAALKNVPGSSEVIDKLFTKQLIQPDLKPAPTKDLVYYHGFDSR